MAAASWDATAMQHRAARNDQAPRSRTDDEFCLFTIIVVDGLAAPIDAPFKIGIVKCSDVLLLRVTVAMGVIAVAKRTAIDIGALI